MWSENGCHVENDIFWSKIWLEFGEPGAKPPRRIPQEYPSAPTGLKDPTLPSAEPSYRLLLFSYSQKKKTKEGAARRVGRCRGGTAHKSDGAARRRISRTPLKGTRILFYGRVPNSLPPLRVTNSKLYNWNCKFQSVIKITFKHFLLKDVLKLLS